MLHFCELNKTITEITSKTSRSVIGYLRTTPENEAILEICYGARFIINNDLVEIVNYVKNKGGE